MNNPDKTIIEAISFFEHNTDNLTPEQLGNIRKLINAYADLNNKTTDVISRRNMQIKDLKAKLPTPMIWKYILNNAEVNITSRDILEYADKEVLKFIANNR
jgi:hypothetical protein